MNVYGWLFMNSYYVGLIESYVSSIFNVFENVPYDYEDTKVLEGNYTLLRSSSDGSFISLMISKSDLSYMVNFNFNQTGNVKVNGLGRISCQYNFHVPHVSFDLIEDLVNTILEIHYD